MASPSGTQHRKRIDIQHWWRGPLLVVGLPVIVLAAAVVLACQFAFQLLVLSAVWSFWCVRGRYSLVVYSDSPIWREYFVKDVLPAAGDRAVELNWSARKQWKLSIAAAAFRAFGGSTAFNPLAIVFIPWQWPQMFRFYEAFRDFKHGRPERVDMLRREFLNALDRASGCRPIHR